MKETAPFVLLALALLAPAPASAVTLSCGDVVGGPNQHVVLEADVGPCDGPALIIAEYTASIDLGGHTVSCSRTDTPVGIDARKAKIPFLASNGSVYGCYIGVLGSTTTVRNMTLNENHIGFSGAACEDSTASRNSNYGFGLHGGSSRNCIADDNGQDGFAVYQADLADSSASGNASDGVSVGDGGSVTGVTVSANRYGIRTYGDGRFVVRDCTAYENREGITVDVGEGSAKVLRNRAYDNRTGIVVSGRARAKSNLVENNDEFGFVSGGRGAAIRHNAGYGNGLDASDPAECRETSWSRNFFATATPCIR